MARNGVSVSLAPHFDSDARSTHLDLAQCLVALEGGDANGAAHPAGAAERVIQKLTRSLARLIAADGAQAILARALHLARPQFPALQAVRAGRAHEAVLEGTADIQNDSHAGAALRTVLANQLDLLCAFIGEDLTLRLVREVWPDLSPVDSPPTAISDGQEAAS